MSDELEVKTSQHVEEQEIILDDKVEEINTPVPIIQEAPVEIEKKQNFIQEIPIFEDAKWDSSLEIVDLPSASREASMDAVNNAPNVSLVGDPASRKWAEVFAGGLEQAGYGDSYVGTITKENSEFHQGVTAGTGVLMGAHPKFSNVENETISGERGVLRLMSYLNMGTIFQIPLWHTGIWVTIRAPAEGDLLELQRQIIADKINLGRQSYGLAFSNTSSYVTDRLVSFVLNHLYESTLQDAADLKTIISSHDIPALLWGMACAIYPRGFQYRRACVTDPDKCKHVVEERLNVAKILWTNTRSLTPSQINHMSKRRTNSMTLESVQRYKEELLDCQKRTITVTGAGNKTTNITLRIPTVAEFVDSGHRWIGEIVSLVNKSLGMDASDTDRNEYIVKKGQASAMRQYLHWVDSLEFSSNLVEDRETLESIFNVLSADDNIRNEFMKKVSEYIDETAITVIGIPAYDCPKCGAPNETKLALPKHTNIIPIDVYQTFFTLLVQKLQRLTVR